MVCLIWGQTQTPQASLLIPLLAIWKGSSCDCNHIYTTGLDHSLCTMIFLIVNALVAQIGSLYTMDIWLEAGSDGQLYYMEHQAPTTTTKHVVSQALDTFIRAAAI